jgi:hypothetical protein
MNQNPMRSGHLFRVTVDLAAVEKTDTERIGRGGSVELLHADFTGRTGRSYTEVPRACNTPLPSWEITTPQCLPIRPFH